MMISFRLRMPAMYSCRPLSAHDYVLQERSSISSPAHVSVKYGPCDFLHRHDPVKTSDVIFLRDVFIKSSGGPDTAGTAYVRCIA
ncbi:hypothetical protein ARMGADRAFT_1020898 [Armillaria gallica]|uniref:Uncharacterized protein n=1 Tax=Armillaria gallica TaxID=47427 RepID=A0A2H3CYN5_ARMGA|nr:hypothetical protein ARMGADRAFT_1020898 [Armillaria gallica]